MLATIIAFLIGAGITGISWLVHTYISNQNKVGRLQDINSAAAERITTTEAQEKEDRARRLETLSNEATQITSAGDAAAALAFLHAQFPGTGPGSGSQMQLPGIP